MVNEEQVPEEENFNDMYDIVKASIKVHTKHDTLNEDFTLANLDPLILENTLIIYIKENINIMVATNNYLNIKGDEQYREMTQKLILDEVTSLTNLSRADKGKVLNAILRYIESQGNVSQLPNQEETTRKGIIGRTVDMIKGRKQE